PRSRAAEQPLQAHPGLVEAGKWKVHELTGPREERQPIAVDDPEAMAGNPATVRGRAQVRLLAGGHDHPGRRLGEEGHGGTPRAREVDPAAEPALLAAEPALGEGDGEAPVGAVVRGAQPSRGRSLEHEGLEPLLRLEVEPGRTARGRPVDDLQELAASEVVVRVAEQVDDVALFLEPG